MPYIAQSEGLIRSIYPPAPVVCGVKLHPLTLGHLAQMEALGVNEQFSDLSTIGGAFVQGLAVCSNTFLKSLELVNNGEWEAECERVGVIAFEHDVDQGIRDFTEYLRCSQDVPRVWSNQGATSVSTGNYITSLKLSIQSELHLSERDVWDMYLTQVIFEHYSILERKGAFKFVTQQDHELSQQVKDDEGAIMEHVRRLGLCQ